MREGRIKLMNGVKALRWELRLECNNEISSEKGTEKKGLWTGENLKVLIGPLW